MALEEFVILSYNNCVFYRYIFIFEYRIPVCIYLIGRHCLAEVEAAR